MGSVAQAIARGVRPDYLMRCYVIGAAIAAYLVYAWWGGERFEGVSALWWGGYLAASLAVFPYAKLVWDDMRDFLMGGTVLFYGNAMMIAAFVARIVVNVALFLLALVIAPIGMIYTYVRATRPIERAEDPDPPIIEQDA